MISFLASVGEGIANAVQTAAKAAGDAITKAAKTIGDGIRNAIQAIPRALKKAARIIPRMIRKAKCLLRSTCKAIVKYIKENPAIVIGGLLIIVVVALPFILKAIGFTATGVAAGSAAAAWQSGIGDVTAGSFFAWLQSLGTWFFLFQEDV